MQLYYIHTYIHTFHRSLRLSPDNRMWNMSKKILKHTRHIKLLQCKNLHMNNPLKTVISPNYTQNFRTNLTEIRIWVHIKEKSINSVQKIIDIHCAKRNTQLHCSSFMFHQVVCCVTTSGPICCTMCVLLFLL